MDSFSAQSPTALDSASRPIVLAFFDVLVFSARVKRLGLAEIHHQ
jgi:hypothetical protein